MRAEIIAVGTELLLGQVVNTNATFLSDELANLGIEVYYQTVVGDNSGRLTELLEIAKNRSDLIVLCGGLGPTADDLTKETVANFVHFPLVQDELGLQRLHDFFSLSKKKMTENNLRQTLTISGGVTLQNPTGLAVGTIISIENTAYLLLPGPPNELIPMFQKQAIPALRSLFPQTEQLHSRVLRFYGIGESQLVTDLQELIESQTNPTIAPYAKANEVTLRITAKVSDEQTGIKLLDAMEEKVMKKVGNFFYGYGDDTSLVDVTVELLKQKGKTISAAESLTAGLFQSTLGSVSGVSEIFKGGFVTYLKETKETFLDLPSGLLDTYGMVSEECAKAMAEQTRVLTDSDLAISFTGVAGPESMEGQAVGTVWIGLSERNQSTHALECQFSGDRNAIRQSAVMKGLDLVRLAINKEK